MTPATDEISVAIDAYQAAIPECCTLRTIDEHANELMFCWGLLSAMDEQREMNCTGCPMNAEASR